MKTRKRRLTLTSLVLLLITTAFPGSACRDVPGGFPVIENQRNEEIRIYVTQVLTDGTLDKRIDYGVVPAKTTKQLAAIGFLNRRIVNRIEAVNPSGKVVFSHDYTIADLEKTQPKLPPEGKLPRWNITIPP
jgi:hypothetical protein